jgi:hypothetical protein
MANNDGRVHLGSAPFPFVSVGIAIAVLIVIVIGVAYVSRTPYGAPVTATQDLETAVMEHLGRVSPRFSKQKLYYNCASFTESMFSSSQSYAAAVEQGDWRPDIQQDGSKGNLEIVKATKTGDSPWQITSRSIPDANFDPSAKPADSPEHPCNRAV